MRNKNTWRGTGHVSTRWPDFRKDEPVDGPTRRTEAAKRAPNELLIPTLTKEGVRDTGSGPGLRARIVQSGVSPMTRTKPHLGSMMADGYAIINAELRRLKAKAEAGEELTPMETRQFESYLKGLSQLAREEREMDKKDDLGSMELSKLLKEAENALTVLKNDGSKN